VAHLVLAADLPIGQLQPFAAQAPPTGSDFGQEVFQVPSDDRPVYAGPGWVGGILRRVESRRCRGGYLLRIEGAGEFAVSEDGAQVVLRQPVQGAKLSQEATAAVLGPCLVLALALQGIWCLHAGGAGTERSAVALIGESGSGKSTLAAALARGSSGWRLVADDLLPIRLDSGVAQVLPRFPQPNLAPRFQWRRPAPETVQLAAVYVLDPGGDEVEVRRLSRREAALALVRQTVAARLFDAELQARHLDFCVEAARRLPILELRYPRRREVLPSMTAAIVAGPAGC
jgi:hypothetical protein